MNPRFLFNARYFLLSVFMILTLSGNAQPIPIPSDVYQWQAPPESKTDRAKQRGILEGTTPAFSFFKVNAVTLLPGQTPHAGHAHGDEELIIVKEGKLTVTIARNEEPLEAGSVALIRPGDHHSFANQSDQPTTYFVMRYLVQGADTGSREIVGKSFVKHWKDLEYKPNDKGGRRNVFDQKTTQADRFEMHITTLNAGLMSHPPHTHPAAEILLLIEGQAEESIDGKWIPAQVGDIIFLQSQVPHAIRNTGKEACTYFAFQFE